MPCMLSPFSQVNITAITEQPTMQERRAAPRMLPDYDPSLYPLIPAPYLEDATAYLNWLDSLCNALEEA